LRTITSRLAAAAAVACVALLAVVPAFATSATGTQNPDLTVRSVLRSTNATSPWTTAAVGDTVTARGCVQNNTSSPVLARIRITLVAPDGTKHSLAYYRELAAGQRACRSYSFVDQAGMPTGTYKLRVAATDANGTSAATSKITFV
jgi:hypothetical protein